MRVLFFEKEHTGHYMEYIHHLYIGAQAHPDNNYLFCLHKEAEEKISKREWPQADNISFSFLSDKQLTWINHPNLIIRGWRASNILRTIIKQNEIEAVLLPTLTLYLPFICLLLPKKVQVSGIIYMIYIHCADTMSKPRLWIEKMRFWLAARSKCIKRILILNDEDSCTELNKSYNTDKFCYIPDPVPNISPSEVSDIRGKLNIPSCNKVYLHFGGLARRKGTLEILKAIKIMGSGAEKKTFIFAGCVYEEIKEEFYRLYREVKEKTQIIIFDEFCPYSLLYNLCHSADYLLMPYQFNHLSSGVLGYASVFNKPVIGPKGGLIGKLIENNHLGITINDITADGLSQALTSNQAMPHSTEYSKKRTREKFIEVLLDAI